MHIILDGDGDDFAGTAIFGLLLDAAVSRNRAPNHARTKARGIVSDTESEIYDLKTTVLEVISAWCDKEG